MNNLQSLCSPFIRTKSECESRITSRSFWKPQYRDLHVGDYSKMPANFHIITDRAKELESPLFLYR